MFSTDKYTSYLEVNSLSFTMFTQDHLVTPSVINLFEIQICFPHVWIAIHFQDKLNFSGCFFFYPYCLQLMILVKGKLDDKCVYLKMKIVIYWVAFYAILVKKFCNWPFGKWKKNSGDKLTGRFFKKDLFWIQWMVGYNESLNMIHIGFPISVVMWYDFYPTSRGGWVGEGGGGGG
jgi:hypothetical protein